MTENAATSSAPSGVTVSAAALRLPSSMSIIFGTALLLLVLGVLGRPAVFPDTSSYMDNGANVYRAAARALHLIPSPRPVSKAIAHERWIHDSFELTMMGARSPWYGLFARPLEWIGTLWLLAAAQAAMAAWLIWLAWRVLAPGAATWTAYAVQGVTASFSTLPFIAGFAMPDVFVSFMILAVALLLVAWGRLHVIERVSLSALAAYSTTVHGANALLAGAMVALAVTAALRATAARQALSVAVCIVICALMAGLTADALSGVAINLIHGQAPGRPPFLAFRLIADGPGRSYLRKVCAHADPYLLCQFKAKPLDNSQAMLWSDHENESVYTPNWPGARILMQREEGRFVLGTVLHDPFRVTISVLRNWAAQLGMVSTSAPLVDQRIYMGDPAHYPAVMPKSPELYISSWNYKFYRDSALPKMLSRAGCTAEGRGCVSRLTVDSAVWLQTAEFALACVALAVIAFVRSRRQTAIMDQTWLQAMALVTFAVIVNALLCGGISGPFARYQSAVAWLATMLAAIGAVSLSGHCVPTFDRDSVDHG